MGDIHGQGRGRRERCRAVTRAGLCAVFLACVVLANVLTATYGLVPVAFGLSATAGTYAAGVTFLVRDLLQERAGRQTTLAVIVAGAALSTLVSPQLAVASGVAFLVSELADWSAYQPTRRAYGFLAGVALSNIVGATVDTLVFMPLAGFPLSALSVSGQIVGKLLLSTVPLLIVGGAARVVFRQPQHTDHP